MKKFSIKIIMLLLSASLVLDIQAMKREREDDTGTVAGTGGGGGTKTKALKKKKAKKDSVKKKPARKKLVHLAKAEDTNNTTEKKRPIEADEVQQTAVHHAEETKDCNELVRVDSKALDSAIIARALRLGSSGIHILDWLKKVPVNGFSFNEELVQFSPSKYISGKMDKNIELIALSKEMVSEKIPVMILYRLSLSIMRKRHVSITGQLYLFRGHDEKIFEKMDSDFKKISNRAISFCRYELNRKDIYISAITTEELYRRKGLSSHLVNTVIRTTQGCRPIFTAIANEYSEELFEKLGFDSADEAVNQKYGLDGITHILLS